MRQWDWKCKLRSEEVGNVTKGNEKKKKKYESNERKSGNNWRERERKKIDEV